MRKQPRRARPDNGASSVEYGLLIAFIATVIIVAVLAFGGAVKGSFTKTCQNYQQPMSGTASCG